MFEPSLETPLVLPHKFYSGHAPTLRLLAVRPPASWSHGSLARWSFTLFAILGQPTTPLTST